MRQGRGKYKRYLNQDDTRLEKAIAFHIKSPQASLIFARQGRSFFLYLFAH